MIVGSPTILNLVPGGVMKCVHVNQVNKNIEIQFKIMNGAAPYNLPEGVTCTIRGTKGDAFGYAAEAAVTAGSNVITVTLTEQLTAVAGAENIFELVFVGAADDMKVSTENFILAVERQAMGEDTVISDSDLSYAEQVLDQLQSVGAVNAQVQQNKTNLAAEISRAQAAEAAEAAARQAADNTLQSNINAEASTRATQDASLQSQINQLVAPSGSAPSAAEITNARVGADGTVYPTLGDAIRTQNIQLKSHLEEFEDVIKADGYNSFDQTYKLLTKEANTYYDQSGAASSSGHDSYKYVTYRDITLYFSVYDPQYTSLAIYPGNTIPSSGYVRYRVVVGGENTLPKTESTAVTISANSLIVISVSKAHGRFTVKNTGVFGGFTLDNSILLNDAQIAQCQTVLDNKYSVSYNNGILSINGNGVQCDFSDADFNAAHGVFELQNLTYHDAVIFNTSNDYLGPVRVNGESIKGAKHGSELTDSVRIFADGTELTSGANVQAQAITIYVESTIATDEFKRYTVWAFNSGKMTVSTVLKTLKALSIDYIFGCGIISCQDDVNVAWINKQMLTGQVLTGLNDNTAIVTTGGTLMSKRISVNSAYGDHRVAFAIYSGRKKLYYYTCYGNNISVPSDTTFASCTELVFM